VFNRTGLYAESHGIIANVSFERAVIKYVLTPCIRISGIVRQIPSSIITTSRPAGKPVGGVENRCASYHSVSFSRFAHAITAVGNG